MPLSMTHVITYATHMLLQISSVQSTTIVSSKEVLTMTIIAVGGGGGGFNPKNWIYLRTFLKKVIKVFLPTVILL